MGKKVDELISNPMQKRKYDPNCSICNPRDDRVSHNQVWRFSRAHPGATPFKPGTNV